MAIGWYIAPYAKRESADRPTRYCAMDDFSILIDDWREAEIEGDQAIVKVRASDANITELDKVFTPVADPAAIWTPTRTKPRNVDGEIVLDGPKVDTLDWRVVDNALFDDVKHDDILRRVDDYILLAERDGYVKITEIEPERGAILERAAKLGFGLDKISPGTFPTTGILDNANRADENPLANGNWTTITGVNALRVVSNQIANAAASYGGSYFTGSTFSGSLEFYVTFPTIGDDDDYVFLVMYTDITSGSEDGYFIQLVHESGTDTVLVNRQDNASATQLGASIAQEAASADSIGIEWVSPILTPYYKVGAGAWGALGTRSDATYAATSVTFGLVLIDTVYRLDNVGGGVVVVAGGAVGPLLDGHLVKHGILQGRLV